MEIDDGGVHQMVEEKEIKRYLLGEMSAAEMAALEEQYFADDQLFDRLNIYEQDLIDRYVCGMLSGGERALFEKAYMASPRRREKVEIARKLMKALDEDASRQALAGYPDSSEFSSMWRYLLAFFRFQKPSVRFGIASVGLLVMLGGAWLIVESVRLHTQLRKLEAQRLELQERAQSAQSQLGQRESQTSQLTAELQRERSRRSQLQEEMSRLQQSGAAVVSLVLFPGTTRELSESSVLAIPKGAEWIGLWLALEREGQYKNYQVTLQMVGGKELWIQDKLLPSQKDSGRSISVVLPVPLFSSGDYLLTLKGTTPKGLIEDVDDYFLRVVRK
jgi:hypothetical protein